MAFSKHVYVQSIVDDGIARLAGLGQLLAHGGPLDRKTLVQAFLTRIEISPRDGKGTAYFARLPVGVGISSFALVAGAGFEPATFGL